MSTNPFFDEDFPKTTSCFIDASSLADEFDPLVLNAGKAPLNLSVDSGMPSDLPVDKEKHSEYCCTIDSLENSTKHSPSLADSNQNPETQNQSFPISWFVDISHENSYEGSPRLKEQASENINSDAPKKNIFNMFVELNEPDSRSNTKDSAYSSKPSSNQLQVKRNYFQCNSESEKQRLTSARSSDSANNDLEMINEKDPFGDCKESGFVSDLPDEKQKSVNREDLDTPPRETSNRDNTDTPKYPSLNSYSSYFVKLSDMDKLPKIQLEPLKERVPMEGGMAKSIPERNLLKKATSRISRSTGFLPIYAENVKSLNRIFPNLNSCGVTSDSTWSSTTSSMAHRHEFEMSMNSILSASSQEILTGGEAKGSRLGDDLLRIFEEEIATDVTVECAGRRVKAHKCVLAARCPFFASMMSGGSVESGGNVIHIEGFSYRAVKFTLRYIYSGESALPTSIDLLELATLADKLGLEGLKENMVAIMKKKLCHNFHDPCSVCTLGVMECLPIALECDLHEIWERGLRWLVEHCVQLWPTKAFGTLPHDVLMRVADKQRVTMTPRNVVEIVLRCKMIGFSLPCSRWADSVKSLLKLVLRAAENFGGSELAAVIRNVTERTPSPLQLSNSTVTNFISGCIEVAPTVQVFAAYEVLCGVSRYLISYSPVEKRIMESWRCACEDTLLHMPVSNVLSNGYKRLPPDLQERLRERGLYVDLSESPAPTVRGSPSVNTNTRKKEFSRIYRSFVPYEQKPHAAIFTTPLKNEKRREMRDKPSESRDKPSESRDKPSESRDKPNLRRPKSSDSHEKSEELNKRQPVVRMTRAQLKREEYNKSVRHANAGLLTDKPRWSSGLIKSYSRPSSTDSSARSSLILSKSSRGLIQSSKGAGARNNPLKSTSLSRVSSDSRGHSTSGTKPPTLKVQNAERDVGLAKGTVVRRAVSMREHPIKSASASCVPGPSVLNGGVKPCVSRSRIPVYVGAGPKPGGASTSSLCARPAAQLGRVASAAASVRKAPAPAPAPGVGETRASHRSPVSPATSSAAKTVNKSPKPNNNSSGESSVLHSTLNRSTTFVKDEPCFPGYQDISKL